MNDRQTSQNASLEMLRALGELTKGFQETAPLLRDTVRQMYAMISGKDQMGYFNAADKIDNASVDEKDIMLLLAVQWICQILHAASKDKALLETLKSIYPDSPLLEGL